VLEGICRRVDMEAWSCGALAARCRRSDVEEIEVWSVGSGLQVCRGGSVEVWGTRALEARGVEAWKYGVLEV